MTANRALRIAAASLVALILLSIAFAVVPVAGTRPGWMLALVKVAVLVFLFTRVVRAHVYTLQWSSMLILLFLAEGVVRATSDPQPSAMLGFAEAVVASTYFAAALAYLRPLKQAARSAAKDVPPEPAGAVPSVEASSAGRSRDAGGSP